MFPLSLLREYIVNCTGTTSILDLHNRRARLQMWKALAP